MRFRRVRYLLEQASVVFPAGPAFNPEYDITAETEVHEYEIRMHLTGDLDKLQYDLTSNPPLSQQQILTLLLTGAASPEEGALPSGEITGAAASVVGGEIGSFVGEKLGHWLRVEEIRIEPLVTTRATTDPTTRVTLGKRISPRIFIKTSVSLRKLWRTTDTSSQPSWPYRSRISCRP